VPLQVVFDLIVGLFCFYSRALSTQAKEPTPHPEEEEEEEEEELFSVRQLYANCPCCNNK
jgi:hypothetical protein